MFQNLSKKAKIGVGVAAAVIVAIVVYSLFVVISRIGKVAVSVDIAPFTAKVTLNGEPVANHSTVYLEPGEYAVEAKQEHFTDFAQNFVISEKDHQIYGLMDPTDDEGQRIYVERIKDFYYVEGIFGEIVNAEGEARLEKYPILAYLPYNKPTFSISFQTKEGGEPQINIKSQRVYYDAAVAKLYSFDKKISVAAYDVQIADYKDPFAGVTFNENDASEAMDFIKRGYGATLNGYTVSVKGLEDGYYGVVLTRTANEGGPYKYTYRMILAKENGALKRVNLTPYPILSQFNAASVPSSTLDAVNQM